MSSSLSQDDASQVRLLSAQYFEMIPPDTLSLPPKESIIRPEIQAAIYNGLFNEAVNWPLPPMRYRTRVLKAILAKIEESISNPDEDVWSFPCSIGQTLSSISYLVICYVYLFYLPSPVVS